MSSALANNARWEKSLLGFLERQVLVTRKPIPKSIDLSGQTALITGANVGLGLEAGKQLLELGVSHLILAVRSKIKGDEAASRLRRQYSAAEISVLIVDMDSYQSINSFVEQCKSLSRLDIVILNAGLMKQKFALNTDTGHESTFQVNYLSTILLTILLLPVLKAKRRLPGPSRLSVVTSDVAFWVSVKGDGGFFTQFDDPANYNPMDTYGKAKLLLIMAVARLAEYVNPEEMIVNTVNPGLTKGTAFSREEGGVFEKYFLPFMKVLLARSLAVGASTYLDGALVQGSDSHGSYCSEWTIKP